MFSASRFSGRQTLSTSFRFGLAALVSDSPILYENGHNRVAYRRGNNRAGAQGSNSQISPKLCLFINYAWQCITQVINLLYYLMAGIVGRLNGIFLNNWQASDTCGMAPRKVALEEHLCIFLVVIFSSWKLPQPIALYSNTFHLSGNAWRLNL